MATAYPNEGPDKRLDLFAILKWLQNALSFHSARPPRWLLKETGWFQNWLPEQIEFVEFGIAWPPYLVSQIVRRDGDIRQVPVSLEHPDGLKWFPGSVLLFRVGWRYDPNWDGGGYIFPTIALKTDFGFPMEKGY